MEEQHTADAYTFEPGECYEEAIKVRRLYALAQIDHDLAAARGIVRTPRGSDPREWF